MTSRRGASCWPGIAGGQCAGPGAAEGSITLAGPPDSSASPPRSAASGASGSSHHSELSGTQAETQSYRSVARVGLQVAEVTAEASSLITTTAT